MCEVGVVGDVVPIYMPACLMILLWSSDWRGGDGGDVPQPVLTFTRQHRQQHSTTPPTPTPTPHQPDAAPPATLQPSQPPPRLTWETLGWGHFAPNFGTEFTSMKKYRYFWGVAARHSMFTPQNRPCPCLIWAPVVGVTA